MFLVKAGGGVYSGSPSALTDCTPNPPDAGVSTAADAHEMRKHKQGHNQQLSLLTKGRITRKPGGSSYTPNISGKLCSVVCPFMFGV